jgi:glycosyltransferase involved in cell wall biosynthesis
LVPINGVAELADAMLFYISDPVKLQEAKKASRKAAEDCYNWDLESGKLLSFIGNIFKNK